MSAGPASAGCDAAAGARMLVFERGGVAFALPVADVREVADLVDLYAVPTVPRQVVGVTNHRGEALPVVEATALLGTPASAPARASQMLVIGGRGDEPGRMGLRIDRVVGFAAPSVRPLAQEGVVRALARHEGSEIPVVDSERLLARAEKIVAEVQARR